MSLSVLIALKHTHWFKHITLVQFSVCIDIKQLTFCALSKLLTLIVLLRSFLP